MNKNCSTCAHHANPVCKISAGDICDPSYAKWEPIESDPHGKAAHEPGAKLDAGKIRAALVLGGFANALTEVCRVGTYGATKYTPEGWLQVPDGEARYTDAMLRHLLAEAAGEQCDRDTGIAHAAHAAWNALARLELALRGAQ